MGFGKKKYRQLLLWFSQKNIYGARVFGVESKCNVRRKKKIFGHKRNIYLFIATYNNRWDLVVVVVVRFW
jgi:hypothetical protein